MKLTRLRLSQIRQFGGSLAIPSFEPGLNLFCGPNEAGKSTIVRSIRAAFFERYRSTVVDDLLSRGETPTSASPTVEVSFEIDGTTYTLTKTFFVKKRCTLTGGPTALDGDEAEEKVARLLSFSYAGKGMSKPEHWGIPGLLWIEQGESHEVVESVGHAADHLRTALESTIGAVASSAGDEVLAVIRVQRDKLLTPGASRARGDYEQAQADLAGLQKRIGDLDLRIAQYQQDVDQLAALKARHEADERNKPWETFRKQLAAAEAALSEAEQLQGRLNAEQGTAKRLEQTQQILADQVRGFATLREDLGTREKDARTALERRGEAQATVRDCETRKEEARKTMEGCSAAVALAEREQLRRDLESALSTATEEEERLAATLRDAEGDEARLNAFEAVAREDAIADEDLETLRTLVAEAQRLETTQQAAATGLSFELDHSVSLTLNGAPVPATSEQRVTTRTVVAIAGVGSITVQPGANDVTELETRLGESRGQIAALTTKIGVASLEEALARRSRADQARTEAAGVKRLLKVRAPKGLDKLRAGLAQATARKNSAAERLQNLPPRPNGPIPTVEDARAAHEEAKAVFQEASDRLSAAAEQFADRQARLDNAQGEAKRLRDIVNDPQTGARETEATAQLADTKMKLDAAKALIAELRTKLGNAQPEILKQDVARLKSSADYSLAAFNARAAEIRGLLGRLETEGANGLEEEREELRVTEQAAARRLEEIKLRAEALDLLVDRMEEKREALTRKLQVPLQIRLDHYVRILFPQARMGLKEDLTPGTLTRGNHSVDFIQLSYGAQEQTALISRLAYADLLKEAGKPTLIMLDDALVHSDGARLEQMKRVIYDGATRHQILLFTCHPERWDGLGVTPRDVRSFVQ